MKKTTLCVASLLLASVSAQAGDLLVKTLWEYSDATSSKPAIIGTTDLRDFGYYGDTIYIQDKTNSKLHLFSKEGIFARTLNSAAYHAIDFDQAGNFVTTNFPVSKIEAKVYNFASQDFSNLGDVATGARTDFPTAWGNVKTGTGYIYGVPAGKTELYRATVTDGSISNTEVYPLSSSSPGQNYVIPVNDDSVIVCLRSSKIFYYDLKQKKEGAVLVSGASQTESIGGSYFEYDDERFLIQAYKSETSYLGAFKVYNITDPENIYVEYTRAANLGTTVNSGSTAVHFETEVKPEGVYVYQFVPKNGMAAYKLYYGAETEIELPSGLDFTQFAGVGESTTSGSQMPKITEMLNNEAFGFLSGSDTVFMGYKYIIDKAENGYLAGGKIKLSTSKAAGKITTLPVTTGENNGFRISMKLAPWPSSSNRADVKMQVSYGSQVKIVSVPNPETNVFPVTDASFSSFDVSFSAEPTPTPVIFEMLKEGDIRLFMQSLMFEGVTIETIDAPTILPNETSHIDPVEISISSIPGATIRYTLDGNDPTTATGTLYTDPFTLSTTTTVKAIAYKGDIVSPVSETTYTFPEEVATIAELRAKPADGTTIYKFTGEAVITLQSAMRNVKFLQDATGAIQLYDKDKLISISHDLNDGITNIYGVLADYYNMLQFQLKKDLEPASSKGHTVTPIETDIESLGNHEAKLVKIKEVTIKGSGNFEAGKDYQLNESSTAVLRTHYSDLDYVGTPIPTSKQDIVGVVLRYNDKNQFIPRSLADFAESTGSGLKDVKTANIYSYDGKLFVNAIAGEKVMVYNLNGQKLYETIVNGEETVIENMPVNELVIVKTDSQTLKVSIR